MDKQLIIDILEYVELREVKIDGEFGESRNFSEILADQLDGQEDMYAHIPEFYFTLQNMLREES